MWISKSDLVSKQGQAKEDTCKRSHSWFCFGPDRFKEGVEGVEGVSLKLRLVNASHTTTTIHRFIEPFALGLVGTQITLTMNMCIMSQFPCFNSAVTTKSVLKSIPSTHLLKLIFQYMHRFIEATLTFFPLVSWKHLSCLSTSYTLGGCYCLMTLLHVRLFMLIYAIIF